MGIEWDDAPARARSAIARLQERMDELVDPYEDDEPEPQFDTWEEHRGER